MNKKSNLQVQQPAGSRVESRGTRKNKKSNKSTKSKNKAIILSISSILLVIVIALLIFGAYIINKTHNALGDISIAPKVEGEDGVIIPIPESDSVKVKPVTMILLGIDQRKGGGGLNTDVILIAALNPITKKGAVIAMPRDTRISYNNGKEVYKANAFYANYYVRAQRDGADKTEAMRKGKEAVKNVFGEFYDIPIQYAVSANFQGFKDVVDVLGGIDIDVDMRMKWSDSHDGTDIDLQPGMQKLDGKQTLDFVRFRQSKENPNASSDFERNNRQTLVMKTIMKKMISLGGITKIGSVIDEIAEDVHTDMPKEEIERMITTYFGINLDNITFMSLQGTWKNPYVYADEQSLNEAKQLLQSILAE